MTPAMTVRIGDGEPVIAESYRFEAPPAIYARSEHAVKRDPSWTQTDPAGHVHRWTEDGIPTAVCRSVHVACDNGDCTLSGPCEGTDVDWWACALCGAEVQPGYVPDWHARSVGDRIIVGPATATVTVAVSTARLPDYTPEGWPVVLEFGTMRSGGRAYWSATRRDHAGRTTATYDVVLDERAAS
jgi:hypothetical protein